MRSIPSSMRAARSPRSVTSPVSGKSSVTAPTPTVSTTRPPESWSTVATWLATFHGRRQGSGVRSVPIVTRVVRTAIAARSDHASTPYAASQTKTPSHPDCSARTACSSCSVALPPGRIMP